MSYIYSYDYKDCLELICSSKLNCKLNDLKVLPKVFSELARQSDVDFKVLSNMTSLKTMVRYSFITMRDYIIKCLDRYSWLSIITLATGEDCYTDFYITENTRNTICKLISKLKAIKIEINDEDLTKVKFNSIIDEALEDCEGFEDCPENVADQILQILHDKGSLKVGEEYKD